MATLQVSENWDDDFEFQIEKRKLSTSTAKTEATENWDDDFEDSRQSPKKIIQRQREESWDDEEDEDDENTEFGLFAEEDRTVTARSRRAALARLSVPTSGHFHPPCSPTSSVFSVPTTVHTYSSTAHLRPTSAFALIPPSPPIHKERERRRLRKKSRPKPQAVFELVEIPSQLRPSFSDVDLPRAASEDANRSDLSVEEPPLVMTADADVDASIGPSGPDSIPHTPTRGAALLSRIGSVKKWGARRKRGESTTPTDANESPVERDPVSNIRKWDPRRRRRGDSTTPVDTVPTGSRTELDNPSQSSTPGKGRRRGWSTIPADVISNDCRNESDPSLTPRASSSLSSYKQRQERREQPLPPLPSLPLLHAESSHPSIQAQAQLPLTVQQRAGSSNWFFRSTSRNGKDIVITTQVNTGINNELESTRSSPSAGVVRSASSRSRNKVESGRDRDGNPTGNNSAFYLKTPNASQTDLSERGESSVCRKMSGKGKDSFVAPGTGNPKLPTLTAMTTPTKLVKRKSFGFVHLGRGFGGHGGGENEVVSRSGRREADEAVGEGKQDMTGRAHDRLKYAGLGLGHAGVKGGSGEVNRDECEKSDSLPEVEKRSRRRSLSRLFMDRDKENKEKETDGVVESEKEVEHEDHLKGKGKEGARSFMGGVRRISLVSASVVGRHKKTKSGASGFVDVNGGSTAHIPPVPTSLPPALSSASQVSLRILSSTRAASLSSPGGSDGVAGDPTVPSAPATPARSNSGSHHSRPPSISSSTKRRRRTLSKSKPRKSEESRDGGLNPALNFQQERVPFFHPSEGRDTTILKTPTRSTSSTIAVKSTPLLPPIELQPPSPPRTATKSHIQRRSRAYTTNEIVEGLEMETLGAGAVGVGSILPVPSFLPNKLSPGKSPSQSQKSVSLGRSTTVNSGGDESTGLSFTGGSSGGGAGGLPRRNSLGDLKIPARISQAQVGLRRDLGMVREFASNVEQLKELQNTYNTLVVDVQTLLDTHVQLRQRAQLPPQPVEKSHPSPNFLTQLKSRPKTSARSNTVGSTTAPGVVGSGCLDVPPSQVTYKTLVETFWNINSKYKVSWECAELLIELGGNSGGDDDGGKGDVMSAPPSAATTSTSAPVIRQYLADAGGEGKMFNLKGKDRAITLTGDESKHPMTTPLSTTPPLSPTAQTQSQSSLAIVSVAGSSSMPDGMSSSNAISSAGPPLPTPPSMSWRASTGRHDLSQRQLVLLRQMLKNNGSASVVGVSDIEAELRPPPPPEDPECYPSASSPYSSSRSQFVNRDWRWGDARNSTITLSEEQESAFGVGEAGRRDRKMEKEKRRSGRLGMSGIRDMLRSLKKGHVEEPQQIGNSNLNEAQSGQQYHHHHFHSRLPNAAALAHPMHSTTSLTTQSSIGSKGVHNQAQAQQEQNRIPIPRIPSQIRRRRRSSTGPESMRSNKGLSPMPFSPSSFNVPKPSPRRPSLASIFRIGNKTKPVSQGVVLPTGVDVGAGEDPATLSSASGRSEHDLSAAPCSSATAGTGCEDSNSTGEEEEDWDRMDSPSDLDAAAAKAHGTADGAYDVSATVRGRGKNKTSTDGRKKPGISPYFQNQSSHEIDQHEPPLPPSLPASSSSTGLGNLLVRHSIIPKRSFSASQSSISGSGGGDGQHLPPNLPSRLFRLEQQQPTDTASVEPFASLRISSSKSAPTTIQSKPANDNFSGSSPGASSRPSSSRSTKILNAKSGSVRSMPPLLPQGQPSSLSSLPDPGMIMTPENIKPLLENAKEVHGKLHECIVEIRALIEDGTAAIGDTGAVEVGP